MRWVWLFSCCVSVTLLFCATGRAEKVVEGDGSTIGIAIGATGIGRFADRFDQDPGTYSPRAFRVEGEVKWRASRWQDLSFSGSRVIYRLHFSKPASRILLTFRFWGTKGTEGQVWVSDDDSEWREVFRYDADSMPMGTQIERTVDLVPYVGEDRRTVFVRFGTQTMWGLLYDFSVLAFEGVPARTEPYVPGLVPANGDLRCCMHEGKVDAELLHFLRRARINVMQWHGPLPGGDTGLPERGQLPTMIEATRAAVHTVHQAGAACILHIAHSFEMEDTDGRRQWREFFDKRWQDYADYFGPKPGLPLELTQRDASGAPISHTYKGRQGYPFCVNNPAVRKYMQGLIRLVHEFGGDGSFHDGLHVSEGGCYCPWCRQRFRDWLKATYTPVELRERFAVQDHAAANPPSGADEPLWLAWRRFTLWTLPDFLREAKQYARALNSYYKLMANCMWGRDAFAPRPGGPEHIELWSHVLDAVFAGATHGAGPRTVGGVKMSNSADYRYLLAASRGKPAVWCQAVPGVESPAAVANLTRLAIGEGATQMGAWQLHNLPREAYPAVFQYHTFLSNRAESLTKMRPWSTVSVWASSRQSPLDSSSTSPLAVSRFLADRHIPHRLLVDGDISEGAFEDVTIMVLPSVAAISQRQLTSLLDFVHAGGCLIMVGPCGIRDEWQRPRTDLPLLKLLGTVSAWPSEPTRQAYGKGVVAWLPGAARLRPPANRDGHLSMLPELIESAGGQGVAAVPATGTKIEVSVTWDGRDRMIVHLLNYAVDPTGEIAAEDIVPLRIQLPRNRKVIAAEFLSPDQETPACSLPVRNVTPGPRTYASLVVPGLHIYGQVELTLAATSPPWEGMPSLRVEGLKESVPGGHLRLHMLLSRPLAARWTVAGPEGWSFRFDDVKIGEAWCHVVIPGDARPGKYRIDIGCKQPGLEELQGEIWILLTQPGE